MCDWEITESAAGITTVRTWFWREWSCKWFRGDRWTAERRSSLHSKHKLYYILYLYRCWGKFICNCILCKINNKICTKPDDRCQSKEQDLSSTQTKHFKLLFLSNSWICLKPYCTHTRIGNVDMKQIHLWNILVNTFFTHQPWFWHSLFNHTSCPFTCRCCIPSLLWNRSLLDRFSYCKLGLEIAQHFNLKFADIAKDNLSNFNLNKAQDQIHNGRFKNIYIYI